MTRASHPGPWQVSTLTPIAVVADAGEDPRHRGERLVVTIAVAAPRREGLTSQDRERIANARIIALTPELLELAEDSIEILDAAIDLWNLAHPAEPDEVLTCLKRRAVELVARANGTPAVAPAGVPQPPAPETAHVR